MSDNLAASAGAIASGSAEAKKAVICVRCRTTAAALELPQTGAYCTSCATDIFHIKAKLGLDRARGACLHYAQQRQQRGISRSSSSSWKGKERAEEEDEAEPSEKGIAVGFSGSDSSLMLLRAVAQYFLPDGADEESLANGADGETGLAKSKRKKKDTRRMDAVGFLNVLHVDTGSLAARGDAGASVDGERIAADDDRVAQLRTVVESISPSFTFVSLRLEDVFLDKVSSGSKDGRTNPARYTLCTSAPSSSRFLLADSDPSPALSPTQALQQLHDAINPPPAQMPRLSLPAALTRSEDLRRILTQQALRRAAREQGACALLLGDTASGTAVRFIEAVAKGEGGKAAVEGAPAALMSELLVCRPLREILAQEVDFQVQAHGLRAPGIAATSYLSSKSGGGERSSIGRLTNGFIANLETNVASTVSTVTQTASKIVLDLPERVEDPGNSHANSKGTIDRPTLQLDTPDAPRIRVGGPPSIIFGSAAQRLIRLAQDVPRWDELMLDSDPSPSTAHACPLCGMPAQSEKAQGWRESISILASANKHAETDRRCSASGPPGSVSLSSALCYGCSLVLDTPPHLVARGPVSAGEVGAAKPRQCMPLPRFVLEATQRVLGRKTSPNGEHMHEDEGLLKSILTLTVGGPVNGESPGAEHGEDVALRKIDQAEMRARIGKFVLSDD